MNNSLVPRHATESWGEGLVNNVHTLSSHSILNSYPSQAPPQFHAHFVGVCKWKLWWKRLVDHTNTSLQTTPVSSLKYLIQERTGLLPRKQALHRYHRKKYVKSNSWHFQDLYYPLDDDQMMLCQCPLEDQATIRLERFPGWHIYIRMVDGNTTMVTLDYPKVWHSSQAAGSGA